jgi:hypothetical protein
MSVQIARRIQKAEEVVATRRPANRQPKMMFFPVDGDAVDVARYHQEVEQAVSDGFFVIRIVPLQPEART